MGYLPVFEILWVGEGLGETLEVDHGAINPQGSSPFVFIMKDSLREELLEARDVLVGDVVVERSVVGVDRPLPEFIEVYSWQ